VDEQRIIKTGQSLISKVEKITAPDGRSWWVSATKVPIKDKEGRSIGTVGISRDITERKKMEEELRRYSGHLEELVEERTKELKEAQNRLLKSERLAAIGELAGMVGHDLRNPLTGITGATYYLKTKYGQKMDHKAKEMVEIIEKAIEYSNKIINDLLEYSREIKLELTEGNLKAITRDALSLVEIPENIQVVDLTENEPKIKVDVDKLKRVFINMIKNAVDAMPKGGKLTIKSKKATDHWEIGFSDTGMGMPRCMLKKIWAPFFTTKAKGMGLGLAICKRIAEAHGGKISVRSAIAKGTTFTVAIPINPPEREEKVWANIPESLLSMTTGPQAK
jgi:signal transduction histidine kinase